MPSPRWATAIRAGSPRSNQAREALSFQTNAVPLDVRKRAATRLAKFCGLGLDTVFFINSGAEANENALKLALAITGRRKVVVAVEGAFHGRAAARRRQVSAEEVVRLPVDAVRCEVHAAQRRRRRSARRSTRKRRAP